MQKDPDEMINLFDDPESLAIRQAHMEMIAKRRQDQIPAAERVGWH